MLIDARQRSKLRQVEIAARLGKPQSFVSKYESGERRLDLPEFLRVAAVLEIDVHAFIQGFREHLVTDNPDAAADDT
nr:helix-turn-helix transcriptional regulator [Pseudomonas chlororaphis]